VQLAPPPAWALHPRKGRCGDRRGGADDAPSISVPLAFIIIHAAYLTRRPYQWCRVGGVLVPPRLIKIVVSACLYLSAQGVASCTSLDRSAQLSFASASFGRLATFPPPCLRTGPAARLSCLTGGLARAQLPPPVAAPELALLGAAAFSCAVAARAFIY
jgi:hypothetical protein